MRKMGSYLWLFCKSCIYLILISVNCNLLVSAKLGNVGESDDVAVWAQSNIPAFNEFGQYTMAIHLVNPCTILAKEYPAIMQQDLERICSVKYNKEVIQPLKTMCPKGNVGKVKRELVSVAIAVTAAVVALGYGAKVYKEQQIHMDTANGLLTQAENIRNNLDMGVIRANALANITGKFDKNLDELIGRFKNMSNEFMVVKESTPQMIFETSKFAHRLATQVQRIGKAKREWKNGDISNALLEAFYMDTNLTSPTFQLESAKPISCLMDQNSKLTFVVKAPVLDDDIVVLKTEKFTRLVQKGTNNDTTCELHFLGPKFALVSKQESCILDANIVHDNSEDKTKKHIQFESSKQCLFRNTSSVIGQSHSTVTELIHQKANQSEYVSSEPKRNFVLRNCRNTAEINYQDYAKQAILNNQVYVYCFGLNITVLGHSFPCPNKILIIPFGVRFSVDTPALQNIVMTEHLSSLVNDFSNKTKQIAHEFYSVKLNYDVLKMELDKAEVPSTTFTWLNPPTHRVFYVIITIIAVILFAMCAWVVYKLYLAKHSTKAPFYI